jgi:hypothetical protein
MASQPQDQDRHHHDPNPTDPKRRPAEMPGSGKRVADTNREDQNNEHKGGASGTGGVGGTGGSVL